MVFSSIISEKLRKWEEGKTENKSTSKICYSHDKIKKKILILKIFFSIMFASLFIILTKVKITSIIGTESKFSMSVIFGPVISKFLGIGFGSSAIVFAHALGVLIGLYKIKSLMSYFIFAPIIFAGIYFAKIFKSEKKLLWFPIASIALFILHPIGREVWFYSLFWTIPLVIVFGNNMIEKMVKNYVARVYIYSLGSAFVDHAIGSILFLYFMNIPKEAWMTAIPFTILERLIIAAGITLTYLFLRISIKAMKDIFVELTVLESEDLGKKEVLLEARRSK